MNEFETVTEIRRSPAEVFAALLDFDRTPMWNPGVSEVRAPAGPFGVGSSVVYVGRFLGRDYESTSRCTEYTPDRRFASESISGPFHWRSITRSTRWPTERGSLAYTEARVADSSSSPSCLSCG